MQIKGTSNEVPFLFLFIDLIYKINYDKYNWCENIISWGGCVRKRVFSIVLMMVLLFNACGKNSEVAETTVITEPTTAYFQREVYSKYAEKDYIPFENSSWLREYKPEFVMIHFTSAVMLDRDNPYDPALNRSIFVDYEIGINYIIDRDGKIICYLPENRAAWHAGEGEYNNEKRLVNKMNKYSIGIELMAIGSVNDMAQYMSSAEYYSLNSDNYGFTEAQYESLKLLVDDICERHDIPVDRFHIIGHEEYSPEKTDPGELFDWSRIVPEENSTDGN